MQEELDEIITGFSEEFNANIPNPTDALTLSFVREENEGLVIGDDTIIPYKSIEGAITVELLNAIARGENIEDLLTEFNEDIDIAFNNNSSRSLWVENTVTWTKGVINYRWGNISDEYKKIVLESMNTWKTKTSEKVSFNELENNGWNNFQLGIYAIGCVTISEKDLGYTPADGGVTGNATLGYRGGNSSTLYLDDDLTGTLLIQTTLHELGHVLGLYHEHQRYDRDSYILIPEEKLSNTTNYGIIPKETSNLRWGVKSVRIGFWTINLYYPIWWNSTYSTVEGDFDFNSIMLYDGFTIQSNKRYLNNYNYTTHQGTTLSENDIQMIKNKY